MGFGGALPGCVGREKKRGKAEERGEVLERSRKNRHEKKKWMKLQGMVKKKGGKKMERKCMEGKVSKGGGGRSRDEEEEELSWSQGEMVSLRELSAVEMARAE